MEFKDTQFMTAEAKKKVLKAFEKFVDGNFAERFFTKDLYHHLHQHCGFIAHFNKDGFYQARFKDSKGVMETILQLESAHKHGSADVQDINKALATVMIGNADSMRHAMDIRRLDELKIQRQNIQSEIDRIERRLGIG